MIGISKIGKILLPAALVVSCGNTNDDGDPERLVPVTMAAVGDDGSVDAHVEWITVREQEAMKRAREEWSQRTAINDGIDVSRLAITSQGGCGPALWLWDAPAQTGRQLCLTRSGGGPMEADSLNNWIRAFSRTGGPLYWGGAVRSVWAGVDSAYLRRGPSFYESDHLVAGQRMDNVGSAILGATVVGMYGPADANRAPMNIRTSFAHNGSCPQSFRVLLRAIDNSDTIDTTCNKLSGTPQGFCRCDANLRVRYGEYYTVKSFPPSAPTGTRPCAMNVHDAGLLISREQDAAQMDTYSLNNNSGLLDLDLCVPF